MSPCKCSADARSSSSHRRRRPRARRSTSLCASPAGLAANRILGEFTHGPPASRFVYINAGTYAGQADTPWGRRAKIPLTGISRALVDKALRSNGVLAVDIEGTGRDGGPVAATVEPLGSGWRLEK